MFNEDTISYKIRKYFFGNKYTKKEKFIIGLAFILMNISFGAAVPVIIGHMGMVDSSNATDKELTFFSIYIISYMVIAYVFFCMSLDFLLGCYCFYTAL